MFEHATGTRASGAAISQVGAIGFLIDAGVLGALVGALGSPPVPARGVSFAATIVVTFKVNARYTFSLRFVPRTKAVMWQFNLPRGP